MRKYYLDNIRWVTVILVVLFHVIYMFNGESATGVIGPFSEVQYQDVLQYLLYPWFMMILFIVSGISSRLALKKTSDREFLKKRTVKLLVPSTIGLLVFQWIQGYVNMRISNSFEEMPDTLPRPILYLIMCLSGTGVLWYIQILWVFVVVLVLIRKITGKKDSFYEKTKDINIWSILLLGIAVYVFSQILNTPVIIVYHFGRYGICFFLGYYVFAHDEVIEKLEKYCIPILISALVSGIAFTIVYWGKNYADNPVLNTPLCVLYGWLMCLAVLGCAKKYFDFSNSFTKFMASRSYGLYIFHYLPISFFGLILHQNNVSALPTYLVVLVTGFAGGFILNEIISRIPVLRWCVLGIRKEKKNNVQG